MPELLTVKELMKLMGISKNIAYKLTKRPDFPTVMVNKKIMINADKLQTWINNGGTKALEEG